MLYPVTRDRMKSNNNKARINFSDEHGTRTAVEAHCEWWRPPVFASPLACALLCMHIAEQAMQHAEILIDNYYFYFSPLASLLNAAAASSLPD